MVRKARAKKAVKKTVKKRAVRVRRAKPVKRKVARRTLAGAPKVKQGTKEKYIIILMNRDKEAMAYFTGETWDTERKLAYVFTVQAMALRIAQDLVKHNVRKGWRVAVASNDFIVGEKGHDFTRSYGLEGNPAPRGAKVKAAADLFEDFTGHAADSARNVKWNVPSVAVQFGELEGVMYNTVRDGKAERYLHKFSKKSRPLLGVSHDGTQLVIVGGRYQFTSAGIEDR